MSECILWSGCIGSHGYGVTYAGGKQRLAHRLAWEAANGCAIPPGMFVCHRCDVRACVNPEHLWLGTARDNNRDCWSKGRRRQLDAAGEANGRARISTEQAKEIRRIYAAGGISQTKLGARYGLRHSQISNIVRGVSWR